MSWLILLVAGLLEVVWAVGLKYTQGFTRPIPSLLTLAAMVASIYLLAVAMRSLPLSTAYAIWVGIGMIGTVVVGLTMLNESMSLFKGISLILVVMGVVGLKLSSNA